MTVDNIFLEDLIKFQQIEFKIIRGYEWNGKRDYTIASEIQKIFQKRLKYKKEGNPLETIYKLVLNSCYGKTIQKPIDKDLKFLTTEELEKYEAKNYMKIMSEKTIDGSDIHVIKVRKSIDKHFAFSLLGVHTLSMSKRIMNEVMGLAEDNGINIHYIDTDSNHMDADSVETLASLYKQEYNKELIGKQMGQFHSDFTSMNGRSDVKCAIESYFISKKIYIDKLLMEDGTIDYMFRMKGVTTEAIKAEAE
jgi:hypothetical protein